MHTHIHACTHMYTNAPVHKALIGKHPSRTHGFYLAAGEPNLGVGACTSSQLPSPSKFFFCDPALSGGREKLDLNSLRPELQVGFVWSSSLVLSPGPPSVTWPHALVDTDWASSQGQAGGEVTACPQDRQTSVPRVLGFKPTSILLRTPRAETEAPSIFRKWQLPLMRW